MQHLQKANGGVVKKGGPEQRKKPYKEGGKKKNLKGHQCRRQKRNTFPKYKQGWVVKKNAEKNRQKSGGRNPR